MALIRHYKYIMFLSLCCLVLILITIITRTVQTSAWVCLLCDQSPERHDLVSFPDMLAEGGQVSNYDPVGGTKYGLRGCNKNSRNPNQNAAKQTVDSHPVGRCVCCGTKAKMRSISASSTLLSFWASSTLLSFWVLPLLIHSCVTLRNLVCLSEHSD